MADKAINLWLDPLGQITLAASDRLGAGSVGTVYKLTHSTNQYAVKLMHQPDQTLAKKLVYMLQFAKVLPNNITTPLMPGYDKKGGKFKGYAMNLLPNSSKRIGILFDDTLRAREGISLKQVARMFKQLSSDLKTIHQNNLVVVDWNINNLMWSLTPDKVVQPYWIDFETWLIANQNFGEPIVLSAQYSDPLIWDHINARLLTRPNFESDRYSFLYFLFLAMTGYEPYDGYHPKLTPEERKQNGIWVLDKNVTRPAFGRSVEIFTDDLLDLEEKYFAKKQRGEFPTNVMENYFNSLVECSKCGAFFPRSRKTCPECQTASKHTIPQMAFAKVLIQTSGAMLFTGFVKGTAYTLTREHNQVVLYSRPARANLKRQVLVEQNVPVRFSLSGSELIGINIQGSDTISVWNSDQLVGNTTSKAFNESGELIFAGNKNGIVHLIGNSVSVYGPHTAFPELLVDTNLPVQGSNGQTMFWADHQSERVFGYHQYFDNQYFWLIDGNKRHELTLGQVDYQSSERLSEQNVLFAHDSLIYIRVIRKGTSHFVRRDIVRFTQNAVTANSSSEVSLSKSISREISRIAFGSQGDNFYLWHPSSKGIIREDLLTGEQEVLPKTDNLVREVDSIIHIGSGSGFGKHFLVQKTNSLIYVSLN